ncbi:kynurenine 3-monooxygenase [Cryptococcus wingfieldii CBS 7118]|uniref:Kynurenine 3-monooxygenase n=1 Tax=Cryptococcus wingfieldii CBS 7118 TaxID=1295528 RepID=A0A1E3K2E8_9TREE|nr:kynurenine 3-monooxygenase [Cryptococcus wingfieldii CBS 7118]ODO07320.1 kynurenine 3-monooxygenase [Cryptococcus wingfieldii CBS 7118]
MTQERSRKALIIGAGPVGALTALSLHRQGWDVELWESRDGKYYHGRTMALTDNLLDPRGEDAPSNLRSINLAISSRGLSALQSVDPALATDFLEEAIPMKGRMIHHTDGKEESQLYDPIHGQCINSISRPILNQRLVQALPEGIKTRFNTKLEHLDFKAKRAYASTSKEGVVPGEEAGEEQKVTGKARGEGTAFDLVIGCDGSWSKVRAAMMRIDRVDFSQSFIPHAYIELHMPADSSRPEGFAMDKNHLHIWPRHAFMLIGLPNKDGSFTLTLFLPFDSLDKIKTREQASAFFKDNFPSAVDIVGEKLLLDDFENNPRGNLVTINCTPSAWSSHALLLGDASHSMVPFYGQGLNCGLEDVRVLSTILARHKISGKTSIPLGKKDDGLELALRAYSVEREGDLKAICELALQNYTEMRSHVLSPMHHLRRHLDTLLTTLFPTLSRSSLPTTSLSSLLASESSSTAFPTNKVKGWTSMYNMVTFRPDVGYAEAMRKESWQKEVVGWVGYVGGAVSVGALGLGVVVGARLARTWLERR